jgi:hypothetical protein
MLQNRIVLLIAVWAQVVGDTGYGGVPGGPCFLFGGVYFWVSLLQRAARSGLMQVRAVVLHKMISDGVEAVWLGF